MRFATILVKQVALLTWLAQGINKKKMASIPATGSICVDEEDLAETINKIGYPIVLKPLDGNHGKGASINVTIGKMLFLVYSPKNTAGASSLKSITGFDFRILVIDNKLVAAAKRPAHVIGNGKIQSKNCY
jgi:cyanophycin synthetase